MQFYCVAGLTLGSEIALPGLISSASGPTAPDVMVRHGDVPEALEGAQHSGPTWQMAPNRFVLRVPGVARFLIAAGREILVAAENGTADDEIAIFLSGTVIGILLHQRARIVLHASAVLVGGRAVLFCGESGAGKSTIAAALNQRGYPVICDDVCAIGLDGPHAPQVLPDGRNLKLWSQAIEKLGVARGSAVRQNLEKYYVEPGSVLSEAVPIGAIYALRDFRPPFSAGIERPNIVDAALLLRHNAYRPLLVRRMDQKALYFQAASKIANWAGIFQLTRRLEFSRMNEVIGWLETHWAQTGLMAEAA